MDSGNLAVAKGKEEDNNMLNFMSTYSSPKRDTDVVEILSLNESKGKQGNVYLILKSKIREIVLMLPNFF